MTEDQTRALPEGLSRSFGELSFSRERLSLLLEEAPEGILLTDFDGRIVYANQKALGLLGDGEELPSRQLQDRVDPGERAHVTPLLASLLRGSAEPRELLFSVGGRSTLVEITGRQAGARSR